MATKATDFLKRVSIFEGLPESALVKLAKLLKERRFSEDQVLVKQGDRGDAMYIVTQGRVKVAVGDQLGREKVLAFLGEGEFFGDMALLAGAPRAATVTAVRDVRVLELRKDDFDVLLSSSLDAMKEMMRVVAARQSATNQRITEEATAESGQGQGLITVVFSPHGGAGKTTVATNLAIALAQTAPDRVVLVDLDLFFGHTHLLLNLSPRSSLAQASPSALRQLDRESFNYYLNTHEDTSLRVLIGANRPEEGEAVTADHVRAALDVLRHQFIHLIVDTGRNFSDPTLAAVEMADRVLLVCPPELLGARDTRECRRIFVDLLGFPAERFTYLLNHPHPYEAVERSALEEALGAKVATEIPNGGDAPALAALDGHPLVMKWPNNVASKAIVDLAGELDHAAREALAMAAR